MIKREITRLLDDWNPIGIDNLPDDEYDCLVERIEIWLGEERQADEFIFLLESYLSDHFGLDPDQESIVEFVSELLDVVAADVDNFERLDGPPLDDEDE
jgi:hypothetical protein